MKRKEKKRKENKEKELGVEDDLGLFDGMVSEDLDPVIFGVRDDDAVIEVHCDSMRTIKLTIYWSPWSKWFEVFSLIIKDLDSVIVVSQMMMRLLRSTATPQG
jgi:hypothetical protein